MIHDTEWMDIPSDDMDLDQARQAVRELRKKVIDLSNLPRTVTEFADRCRECGAKYGKLLKQHLCGDTISRQAVAELLLKYAHSMEGKAFAEFLVSQINALPSVTPKPNTDMLDKIRAEIDEQYDRVHPYNISCAEGLEMALDIIDKYKAESEE